MAFKALGGGGIMPDLGPHATGVGDANVFIQTGGEKIRLAVVTAPLVSHTIDGADSVAN